MSPYMEDDYTFGTIDKSIAYLLDTEIWKNLKGDFGEWAIGAAPFELWVAAYNRYAISKNDSNNTIDWRLQDKYYVMKKHSDTEYRYYIYNAERYMLYRSIGTSTSVRLDDNILASAYNYNSNISNIYIRPNSIRFNINTTTSTGDATHKKGIRPVVAISKNKYIMRLNNTENIVLEER